VCQQNWLACIDEKKSRELKMAEKLSDLAGDLQLEAARDQRRRRKLQKRQLRRIVTFFIWANGSLGAFVGAFAFLERLYPHSHPIITERVLIATISGLTVQVGAIIIAAFRGLFRDNTAT
jgi:hypothetical protein